MRRAKDENRLAFSAEWALVGSGDRCLLIGIERTIGIGSLYAIQIIQAVAYAKIDEPTY